MNTMDARFKSIEGKRYSEVFANKVLLSRIYPMDSKKKAVDALRLFFQEFGTPERLTFDGSKEQINPGIIIIIIIFISSIKTIEPVFSLILGASCFDRYAFERKNSYALLTKLKYSSAWFGDMPVEAEQCLYK